MRRSLFHDFAIETEWFERRFLAISCHTDKIT